MSIEKRQLAFGGRLRRLREDAGFGTGKEFAEHLGWIASKVSRIETGTTLPADSDLTTWIEATDTPETVAVELQDELLDLRLARNNWKRQLRTGHADRQRQSADVEQSAARITMVEFYLVPGLVQTAEYARAVFTMAAELHESPRDTDEAVRARVRRQDALYDPDKQIEILVAEVALRYPLCPPPVLRAQVDRLISLAALPNIRLGVIPLGTVLPVITMHGYTMIDDTIYVEINHTELTTADQDDLTLYRRLTDQLWTVAAEGDDARAMLTRLAAAHQ